MKKDDKTLDTTAETKPAKKAKKVKAEKQFPMAVTPVYADLQKSFHHFLESHTQKKSLTQRF